MNRSAYSEIRKRPGPAFFWYRYHWEKNLSAFVTFLFMNGSWWNFHWLFWTPMRPGNSKTGGRCPQRLRQPRPCAPRSKWQVRLDGLLVGNTSAPNSYWPVILINKMWQHKTRFIFSSPSPLKFRDSHTLLCYYSHKCLINNLKVLATLVKMLSHCTLLYTIGSQ